MMSLFCGPVNEKVANKDFVWFWLQTPIVRDFIQSNARGTSPTMKKISQGTVMNIPFPAWLSLREQEQVVEELKALQEKIERCKSMQTRSYYELGSILPSILDKAFKGEL